MFVAIFWITVGVLKIYSVFFAVGGALPTTSLFGLSSVSAVLVIGFCELVLAAILLSKAWRVGMRVSLGLLLCFWVLALWGESFAGSQQGCGCFGAVRVSYTMHLVLIIGTFFIGLCALFTHASDCRYEKLR